MRLAAEDLQKLSKKTECAHCGTLWNHKPGEKWL